MPTVVLSSPLTGDKQGGILAGEDARAVEEYEKEVIQEDTDNVPVDKVPPGEDGGEEKVRLHVPPLLAALAGVG